MLCHGPEAEPLTTAAAVNGCEILRWAQEMERICRTFSSMLQQQKTLVETRVTASLRRVRSRRDQLQRLPRVLCRALQSWWAWLRHWPAGRSASECQCRP